MRRYVVLAVVLLAAMTLMVSSAFGQAETGQIAGTVLDQTGAALPGAEITAKNLATGTPRSTVSNTAGVYAIPNLPPGSYELMITATGFSTYKQTVTVGPGVRVGVDAQMKVGATTTTVEVTETVVAVKNETQAPTTRIDTRENTGIASLHPKPYNFLGHRPNASPDAHSG